MKLWARNKFFALRERSDGLIYSLGHRSGPGKRGARSYVASGQSTGISLA